jgi:NAD(P)-dependent dehydrogenase (short-subunit alcohol dehydrogenase family)
MTAIEVKARTALITGSSRGIGRGIALKLAECGVAKIGVHYLRNEAAARETARLLQERGAEALLIQADVTKPGDISRMILRTLNGAIGPLHL